MEVHIKELSKIKMVNGNENKYGIVIHNGEIKNWVGFGWINEGKAIEKDYTKYPSVKEG